MGQVLIRDIMGIPKHPHRLHWRKIFFGVDCCSPTEAEITPPSNWDPTSIADYREELMLSLSSAWQLANKVIQQAQRKYKAQFDRKAHLGRFQIGEWVLIKFPHKESGKNRKLSRPWHGPLL